MKPLHSASRQLACALAIGALSSAAWADPYSISYTGTITNSTFAEIINGQSFRVTLVLDNGGTTALNQFWGASDVQCAIWEMNDDRSVIFAQEIDSEDGDFVNGPAETDAGGSLIDVFSSMNTESGGNGAFAFSGFTPQMPVIWYLGSFNDIFFDDDNRAFGDAADGVQMNIANWTNPVAFPGDCLAVAAAPQPVATPIPTLSEFGGIVLAALIGLGAALGLRRRNTTPIS